MSPSNTLPSPNSTARQTPSRALLFGFQPWLLVCLSLTLASVIIFFALRNTGKEREYITQNFLDRADTLIWALEAATRTGITLGKEDALLQSFVTETAKQKGILSIAIVDDKGNILAHSNPEKVGETLPKEKLPSNEPPQTVALQARQSPDSSIYEVYREFAPAPGYHHMTHGMHRGMHGQARFGRHRQAPVRTVAEAVPRSFAIIAFDRTPYEELFAGERLGNAMTALVAAVLGLGSFFSLFWAHSYKRSRRLLQDSRALASEVVSNLPLGLITCEPNGAIGMINDTALNILRLSREQALGKAVQTIPGLDWAGVMASLARTGKPLERELDFCPGGACIPVNLNASSIRNEDGLFLGHLFILRDISEVKRLQGEARRNDRLAALGSLAAGVAHEIRNPLSTIKGLATFLAGRMKTAKAHPEEEAAKTMLSEADRLNRVVSKLLEFARPGAGVVTATDVNELVAGALKLADADIRVKNITVAFSGNSSLPLLPLNAERMTQALLNLFLNAIQAMDPGGMLGIGLSLREQDGLLLIDIRDNGCGMSSETQAAIFTPYFTTKPSGTGLGLAIVNKIIEEHRGSITVASSPGSGSVFTLRLPVARICQVK